MQKKLETCESEKKQKDKRVTYKFDEKTQTFESKGNQKAKMDDEKIDDRSQEEIDADKIVEGFFEDENINL